MKATPRPERSAERFVEAHDDDREYRVNWWGAAVSYDYNDDPVEVPSRQRKVRRSNQKVGEVVK